ncbi:unnamed protein product [[Candida] boidinii]|uniref:Unnamed protein product n=1 Tax=Candida boidinii TaxID=5477 RepID=A0A9W6SZ80_CANBO|nr:unnamed protein product [[Candida] boidinii]GMG16621.1 unnamed protein product [[Candida] boidinii]
MDRKNEIEKLLLSRCSKYNKDGEILKLLEARYSVTGTQKDFLVLEGTKDGGVSVNRDDIKNKNEKKQIKTTKNEIINIGPKSIVSQSKKGRFSNKYDQTSTRNEFGRFIKDNLKNQRQLYKQINKDLSKPSPGGDHSINLNQYKRYKYVLKFEEFLEINRLWSGYIADLMKGQLHKVSTATMRLATSEFVGAFIEVSHSTVAGNVGQAGIVIWESQHNFIIVVAASDNWKRGVSAVNLPAHHTFTASEIVGGLRVVSKANTRFRLAVPVQKSGSNSAKDPADVVEDGGDAVEEQLEFEVLGNRVQFRPSERSNKKFKSRSVSDLLV